MKVLPDQHFGLIHGKAGVITLADGTKTAFLSSVNESKSAWTLNYELMWQWIRTPLPPKSEHPDFDILRRSLALPDSQVSANGSDWDRLTLPDKARVRRMFPRFLSQHNPFIRHIARRSRKYLEETKDPETREPYLKPIAVELLGEQEEDAIKLPLYLHEAYALAEEFCRMLGGRMKGSGFLRTLLLRRVGSSITAGRLTAEKMLSSWQDIDAVKWLAEQLMDDLPGERIAIYASSGKSGIWQDGRFAAVAREDIKLQVRRGEIRLLLGTDAASEGLNLQRLSTLINLDLPWNPTRLEQRKGRIQRIGQLSDTVYVYNMRYRGSVEDRVHQLLSSRLQDIYTLFGQVPDVLEDVWIDVALGEVERAKQVIAAVPKQHPFDIKYQRIEKIDWETCERVLSPAAKRAVLTRGW